MQNTKKIRGNIISITAMLFDFVRMWHNLQVKRENVNQLIYALQNPSGKTGPITFKLFYFANYIPSHMFLVAIMNVGFVIKTDLGSNTRVQTSFKHRF